MPDNDPQERKQDPSPKEKDQMEKELLEKLPSETDPSAERGERLATGKAIATGGTNTTKENAKRK